MSRATGKPMRAGESECGASLRLRIKDFIVINLYHRAAGRLSKTESAPVTKATNGLDELQACGTGAEDCQPALRSRPLLLCLAGTHAIGSDYLKNHAAGTPLVTSMEYVDLAVY
jgi:hypothetical protein